MERTGRILFGLLLTAGYLFLLLCLLSPSSFYPPERLLQSVSELHRNYAGSVGLNVSFMILHLFGIGAFFLLIPFGIYTICFWIGHHCEHPIINTAGMILLLTGICGFSAFLFPDSSFGPVVSGAGGALGALIQTIFSTYFAPLGAYIFLISFLIAGLILSCNPPLLKSFLILSGIYPLSELLFNSLSGKKKEPVPVSEEQPESNLSEVTPNPTEVQPDISPIPTEAPVFEEQAPIEAAAVRTSSEKEPGSHQAFSFEKPEEKEYIFPAIDLLEEADTFDLSRIQENVERLSLQLEKAFADFGFEVKVVDTQTGPVITMYEIRLAPGTKIAHIRATAPDLEIAMRVPGIRIVAPIPGKNTVGVEIPNTERQYVRLRELMEECTNQVDRMKIPIFLGKDVTGAPMVVDLVKLPHLLIAGRTGTGKSVCLNAIIMSILMTRPPKDVRMIMIDPKMVELNLYQSVPHLMHPVVIDMKKAEAILAWAVDKMEERYNILSQSGVRNLDEYNKLSPEDLYKRFKPQSEEEWEAIPKSMPFIIIVADEMADLMMTYGKEVEIHIARLAAKSRAVGIHLVLATQKPTVDIITGLIKSNLPARIAFGVASRVDSQVVLDCKGAEQLLGNGDMLFLLPATSRVVRGQGTFVSIKEINGVIGAISTGEQIFEPLITESEESEIDVSNEEKDILYDAVAEALFNGATPSVSFIQRKFRIGYTRSARIFDFLEADGVVSKANPIKKSDPRKLLITYEEWKQLSSPEAQKERLAEKRMKAAEAQLPKEEKPKSVFNPFVKKSDPNEGIFVGEPLMPKSSSSEETSDSATVPDDKIEEEAEAPEENFENVLPENEDPEESEEEYEEEYEEDSEEEYDSEEEESEEDLDEEDEWDDSEESEDDLEEEEFGEEEAEEEPEEDLGEDEPAEEEEPEEPEETESERARLDEEDWDTEEPKNTAENSDGWNDERWKEYFDQWEEESEEGSDQKSDDPAEGDSQSISLRDWARKRKKKKKKRKK
ncbi:MAG: DNA translocase FtsK 4TM domain-containing protein [Planctomycetia bacterium]|nr:DNA translocase FtsK 4TM domain-containing protein [Planctomycetia bacterium]